MSVALYARVSSVFGNQPDRHSLKGGIHVTSPNAGSVSFSPASGRSARLPARGRGPAGAVGGTRVGLGFATNCRQ